MERGGAANEMGWVCARESKIFPFHALLLSFAPLSFRNFERSRRVTRTGGNHSEDDCAPRVFPPFSTNSGNHSWEKCRWNYSLLMFIGIIFYRFLILIRDKMGAWNAIYSAFRIISKWWKSRSIINQKRMFSVLHPLSIKIRKIITSVRNKVSL